MAKMSSLALINRSARVLYNSEATTSLPLW
jgi:hypothetical protein